MRLRPFIGLVPTGDLTGRTVPGAVRGSERLRRRAGHPRHVSWLEAGDHEDVADAEVWVADGSLRQDETPRLRVVETRAPSGWTSVGILGSVHLGDLVPHEDTDPPSVRRRADRDRRQQVFSRPLLAILPADPEPVRRAVATARARAAELDVEDDEGYRHRTWPLTGDEAATVAAAVADLPCLLGDGHHRVAAAVLQGRTELPTLVCLASEGPRIQRVWRVAAVPRDRQDDAAAWLAALPGGDGVDVRHGSLVRQVAAHDDELGVEASFRVASRVPGVARVTSTADPTVVAVALRDGAVVVSAEPPSVTEILNAVASGRSLPPKSTAFTPKPHVGLVLQRAEAVDGVTS